MDPATIAVIAGLFLAYSLVSGRLEGTVLTAPLLFVAFGFLAGSGGFGLVDIDIDYSVIHIVAEFTLILVLFADASRIDLKRVRRDHNLPARMLLIGLPLTIAVGMFFTALLFPAFAVWEAALLAALLAPTDAALGQSVVSAKAVPIRIRQSINIESGLNDCIALPALPTAPTRPAIGCDSGYYRSRSGRLRAPLSAVLAHACSTRRPNARG